jgi:uncharacterized protein YndB with AHSA1/START domain
LSDTTERSIEHATFTLERVYPHPKERVFAAFTTREAKAKWFGDPVPETQWDLDFREGGREYNSGPFRGQVHTFDAVYLDIVENERLAYSYNMYVDDVKLSSSFAVIELTAVDGGTKITFTETGAFFDGHEDPSLRENGSGWILDALGASLK